ncbi:hypothetical protein C8Q77DRAFT_1134601 [Trametes polyzona]|nr:hypothetical protein C8Q77DRAFT_1134601 [Trametes polyzona]
MRQNQTARLAYANNCSLNWQGRLAKKLNGLVGGGHFSVFDSRQPRATCFEESRYDHPGGKCSAFAQSPSKPKRRIARGGSHAMRPVVQRPSVDSSNEHADEDRIVLAPPPTREPITHTYSPDAPAYDMMHPCTTKVESDEEGACLLEKVTLPPLSAILCDKCWRELSLPVQPSRPFGRKSEVTHPGAYRIRSHPVSRVSTHHLRNPGPGSLTKRHGFPLTPTTLPPSELAPSYFPHAAPLPAITAASSLSALIRPRPLGLQGDIAESPEYIARREDPRIRDNPPLECTCMNRMRLLPPTSAAGPSTYTFSNANPRLLPGSGTAPPHPTAFTLNPMLRPSPEHRAHKRPVDVRRMHSHAIHTRLRTQILRPSSQGLTLVSKALTPLAPATPRLPTDPGPLLRARRRAPLHVPTEFRYEPRPRRMRPFKFRFVSFDSGGSAGSNPPSSSTPSPSSSPSPSPAPPTAPLGISAAGHRACI